MARISLRNAARGASNRMLLTRLGGGAFGNDDAWIDAAILRALRLVRDQDLEVEMVGYGAPPSGLRNLVDLHRRDCSVRPRS